MRFFRYVFAGVFGVLFLTTSAVLAAGKIQASQLVGAWVGTTAADMSGMEFAKDGKVTIYFGTATDAEVGDYSIADDGRLSISLGGGGLVDFFEPTLSGDQLQLKDAGTNSVSQYRRLKAGETVASAMAAQGQADKKAIQDRDAAVPGFLKQQDLTMQIIGGGPNVPTQAALQLAPAGGNDFTGNICFDSKPPRVTPISVEIKPADNDNRLSVSIWFGPGTPQQGGNREVWTFHASGAGPNITLTSKVNFGDTFSTNEPSTVIIRSDATMHKAILDRLKTEVDRLEALRAPIVGMLKDYTVLKGGSQSMLPAEKDGFTDQFILSRAPQSQTWSGQGETVNRATGATDIFPVVAGVVIANGKPAITIQSQKRIYQFADIDVAGGKLNGLWQMPNNPNGKGAMLTVTQAVDAKTRDQMFTTRKASLAKLAPGTIYHAVISDEYNNGTQPPSAVTVTLNTGAGGAITGTAQYVLEGCTMAVSGKEADTPLGPQLVLQYTGGKADSNLFSDVAGFITSIQHETWIVSPDENAAGDMELSGYGVLNPTPNSPPISVQLIPYTDKDKAAIAQALAGGVHFKAINPKMGGPDTIFQLNTDPTAADKIKGSLVSGGNTIGITAGTTFTGKPTAVPGWVVLDTPILPANSTRANYGYKMFITITDGQLYMDAFTYSTNLNGRPLGRWDAAQVKP